MIWRAVHLIYARCFLTVLSPSAKQHSDVKILVLRLSFWLTSQKLRRLVNLPFVSSKVNTSPVEKQGHILNHLLRLELNPWISPMGVMMLLKNLGKKWRTNLFTSSYSFSNFLYKLLKRWDFFHNTFFFRALFTPRFPFLKLWSVLWHTSNFVT